MNKTKLVYGSYKLKEMDEIIEIFEESGVEYELYKHVHTHGANKPSNEKDSWTFYQLKSDVTPEEESVIRPKRDLLKKRYS